jgi:hypothetical protein
VTTVTRAAGDREHASQGLHGFIPGEIIAKGQTVVAVGAGEEFGLINEALLGV